MKVRRAAQLLRDALILTAAGLAAIANGLLWGVSCLVVALLFWFVFLGLDEEPAIERQADAPRSGLVTRTDKKPPEEPAAERLGEPFVWERPTQVRGTRYTGIALHFDEVARRAEAPVNVCTIGTPDAAVTLRVPRGGCTLDNGVRFEECCALRIDGVCLTIDGISVDEPVEPVEPSPVPEGPARDARRIARQLQEGR